MDNEQRIWERELSGHMTIATCKCPTCGIVYDTPMPVEFANDLNVEKNDGKFSVLCEVCRRTFRENK